MHKDEELKTRTANLKKFVMWPLTKKGEEDKRATTKALKLNRAAWLALGKTICAEWS